MKTGKISEAQCRRSVLRLLPETSERTLQGAGIGMDCAILRLSDGGRLATAVAVSALDTQSPERYAFGRACNKLATSGAAPEAIQAVVLLPARGSEDRIKAVTRGLAELCQAYEIDYIGGHTELLEELRAPAITVTVYGSLPAEAPTYSIRRVRPGMHLLMLGTAGAEAAVMLLRDYREQLHTRYSGFYLDAAEAMEPQLRIWSSLLQIPQDSAVYLHDCSTGGVFAALWEIGEGSGCGIEAELEQIPIRQETIEICEYFDVNPYMAMSGGSAIVVTERPEETIEYLAQNGIGAWPIGKTTDSAERVVLQEDDRRYLTPPRGDEIYKIYRN